MKRLLGGLVVVFVSMTVPLAGYADDVRDGADCNAGNESFADTPWLLNPDPGNTDDVDRGSFCIRAGGTTYFYLGGEAEPEQPSNRGSSSGFPHGLCGSLTIFGSTFGSAHPDRNNANPEGEQPYPTNWTTAAQRDADWDFMHSHGAGEDLIWRTDDDVWHHHHCD